LTKNVKINHDISIITNIAIISIGISLIIHSIGIGNPNTSNSLIFNKLQQQKQQGPPHINSSLHAALFTTGNQENKNIGNLNNNSSKAVILTFEDGYQSQYCD
jgi:hypothetical protein